MLGQASTVTILPVQDLERARRYYADQLGLRAVGVHSNGQFHFALGSGGLLALFKKSGFQPSGTTAMSFAVDDIHSMILDLEARGVAFEDYDFPGFRTENHVAQIGTEKAAWFKDPDGHILCLHQEIKPG